MHMSIQNELLDEIMDKVTEKAMSSLKDTLSRTLDQEIAKALGRALLDTEFYRTLNEELRNGLGCVYKEILSAKSENSSPTQEHAHGDPRELFLEASDQLDQILRTTEQATVDIMDILERHLEVLPETERIIAGLIERHGKDERLQGLAETTSALQQDLMSIMTILSFQDLTGQRIKRIVEALRKVEGIVLDLVLSTGLVLKAREEEPDRELSELREESRKKIMTLRGPQGGVSQSDVDDLLANLGL
jgi:chemotaxis protein CheZ